MKNYTITVNGNVYDVTVEEKGGSASVSAPVAAAPVAAKPAAPVKSAAAGSVPVTAQSTGKIFSIDSKVGQAVKKGDQILTLEAMKMELPVVAPQDGVIASIDVAKGDEVQAGATLATLN